MRLAFVSVLAAGLAVGCTTVDPYSGESKTSNTTKGAVTGAAVGAVLGAIINHDDREKGAAIGAALGGAAGGGYGYYMDRQEAMLRQKLAGTGVSVAREGDAITLVMPGNITFDTAKFDVKAAFYPVLDSVATVLVEFDETIIHVAGFTDSVGSAVSNKTLSERRASSVSGYLMGKGITGARIDAVGYGEEYAIADNNTAEGRAQNRRVELQLVPPATAQ